MRADPAPPAVRLGAAILAAVAGLYCTTGASAHHGGFEICNQSSNKYYVTTAYRSGLGIFRDNWYLSGRYIIEAGRCASIMQPMSDLLQMYVAVKKPGLLYGLSEVNFRTGAFRTSGRFGSEADVRLCTKDEKFSREGSLSSLAICSSDQQPQSFSIYLHVPAIPIDQHYINTLYLH